MLHSAVNSIINFNKMVTSYAPLLSITTDNSNFRGNSILIKYLRANIIRNILCEFEME